MGCLEALVEEGVEHRHGDQDRMEIKTKILFHNQIAGYGEIKLKNQSSDLVENEKRNEETEPNNEGTFLKE